MAPAKAPFATLPVSLSSFFTLSKSFFKRPRALGVTSSPRESFSTVLLLTPVFLRAPAAPLTFALPSCPSFSDSSSSANSISSTAFLAALLIPEPTALGIPEKRLPILVALPVNTERTPPNIFLSAGPSPTMLARIKVPKAPKATAAAVAFSFITSAKAVNAGRSLVCIFCIISSKVLDKIMKGFT